MNGQQLAFRIEQIAQELQLPLVSVCMRLGMTLAEHKRLKQGQEPRPWQVMAVQRANDNAS
jgi:hypothetical protein